MLANSPHHYSRYDASYYDDRLAHDWIGYVNACERAPRRFHDIEWAGRIQHDDALLRSICDRSPDADINQTDLSMRRADGGGGMDRYYDHVYGLGCHRTLPDYNRMEKAQDRVWAAGLPKSILREAMSKLPSLKSIVFSDWRELAQSGESYDDCAFRLFGNTLAPRTLERNDHKLITELDMILKEVASNPRIESFSTGSPVFEYYFSLERGHLMDTGHFRSLDAGQLLPSIGLPVLLQVLGSEQLSFSHLRRLDLQINREGMTLRSMSLRQSYDLSALHKCLLSMTNLNHLSLGLARALSASDFEENAIVGESTLPQLLLGLNFSNLSNLRLEGWKSSANFLEELLKPHAATLKTVIFTHCTVHGDARRLAEWAATNLRLDGISLWSVKVSSDEERTSMSEDEEIWLAGRMNHLIPSNPPVKVVGYSDDGNRYDNDSGRPWWTQRLVWD